MKKLLAILLLLPALTFAWEPSKPIKVIVPTAPGAGNEMAFRAVASVVEKSGKATFIIENRAGADGNIGMNQLAESPNDGYTIAVPACQSTFVASDIHYKNIIKFNPMDFTLVTNIGKSPLSFVARSTSTVSNFPALISTMKSGRPVVFAVGGAAHRLAIEYLIDKIGADRKNVTIVEYKGPLPAVTDVAGGHAEFGVMPIAVSNTLMPTGKIKLLALAGEQTVPAYPRVTLAKDTIPGLNVYGCWNVVLPKGTDPAIQKWYVDHFVPALKTAEFKRWADENQVVIDTKNLGPVALRKDMEQLRAQWGPYVRQMPGPGGK